MNNFSPATRQHAALLVAGLIMLFALAACGPIQAPDSAVEVEPVLTEAAPTEETAETEAAAAPLPIPTETYNGIPVGFTPEGFPFRGDPNAPVTMFEYSDYECPFCARYFVQTEPAINESFVRSGQLMVIFRDFPIEALHPNAPMAHVASLCVGDQGAALYWAMHGKLFQTQAEWSNLPDPLPVFERLAKESGADLDRYGTCIADPAPKQAFIADAIAEGQAADVSGTPSFSFRSTPDDASYLLVGAQPYEQFAAYIEAIAAGEAPVTAEGGASGGGEAQIPVWATVEGWQPDPERPGVNMAGDNYHGDLDAKVVVVEFSDFQCPFCKRHVDDTQPALDEEFVDTGEVMWIFKHFPLNIHPQAPAAGVAAECASDQGKFWEMHALLFEDPQSWSTSDPSSIFAELAGQLELDMDAFNTCYADPATAERVTSDLNDGAPFVQGTPTFIVLFNGEGRIIPGALPLETFREALQEIVGQAN